MMRKSPSRPLLVLIAVLGYLTFNVGFSQADEAYRLIAPREKNISLDLKQVEIHNALKLLAEVGNANLAFQKDVRGTIRNLNLRNVPASQVFEIMLRLKGLYAVEEGKITIVYPLETYISDSKARAELYQIKEDRGKRLK